MRTRSDSPTKNCTRDGCSNPLRAKGLCGTHYNQALPNRHPKVTMTCAGCGTDVVKDAGRDRRYANVFCSLLCRDYHQSGGPLSSRIPTDHWARMYGAACEWVSPRQPRAYHCEWCGTASMSTQERAKYCTRKCKLAHSKVRRRGIEHGATGDYTWMDITRLWVLFDKACAYCATPTPLADIQAEHVQPISRGGANNLSNLLPSCGPCNSDKRDLTLTQWRDDRTRRGLAPVTTEWNSADPRYKHLTTGHALAA